MSNTALPTFFAPAERASVYELSRQAGLVASFPLIRDFLNAVPDILLVLNQQRQVIFANRTLLNLLGLDVSAFDIGQRPGEVLNCVHSHETEGGCGTSESCRTCGAVKAILNSQKMDEEMTEECRVTRSDGEAMDLRVRARPLKVADEKFTVFAINDISNEKRRRALERIFFHDVLNTAGGLRGLSELMLKAGDVEQEELRKIIYSLSEELVEQILAQRELLAAENNELKVQPSQIEALELLTEMAVSFRKQRDAEGKRIEIDPKSEPFTIYTDPVLLRRVLGNLIKNALEACQPGEVVTLGCSPNGKKGIFRVHNPEFIPRDVQLQIFQRSFSTKGSGRGLGTYSIRLLSERYLKGRAFFHTSPDEGTTFQVEYPLKPKTT